MNLGQKRKVTGVVIQGCPSNDHWVTKFKLQHSMDAVTWTDYMADGQVSPRLPAGLDHTRVRGSHVRLKPLWFSFIYSFSRAQQTETLLRLSCWVRLCPLSTSASSRWSSEVRRGFASTSWDAHLTVRKPFFDQTETAG